MDFNTAEELLALCDKENKPISEIMRLREIVYGDDDAKTVDERMKILMIRPIAVIVYDVRRLF